MQFEVISMAISVGEGGMSKGRVAVPYSARAVKYSPLRRVGMLFAAGLAIYFTPYVCAYVGVSACA